MEYESDSPILVTVAGMLMLSNEAQPEKARSDIVLIPSLRFNSFNALQSCRTDSGSVLQPVPNLIEQSRAFDAKALFPIDVTASGMYNEGTPLDENAYPPIVVRVSGRTSGFQTVEFFPADANA